MNNTTPPLPFLPLPTCLSQSQLNDSSSVAGLSFGAEGDRSLMPVPPRILSPDLFRDKRELEGLVDWPPLTPLCRLLLGTRAVGNCYPRVTGDRRLDRFL
ncbi:hypothetical protein N7510_011221 [Penicillium lagena]|uniref:uncharacterized protein n=1 Tax=Penicillium lagena TaxID=94218 RepID=UPI002541C1AE|nr:uncharacterized protein N7510_011221 [Penicillium lagena]KAJ5601687.1 hypothetical protein N7510_011221 [Penicillium lagena]